MKGKAMASEMTLTDSKIRRQTSFDVEVETASGMLLIVFQGIEAQTKGEAINKVKQMLTFSAERNK